eukprot:TRINITY_DN2858_c0_g1_i1.p1 TRINITY_DN2858_c0_g1~~TRINITY_DN2858_c0_g1_i1.p1  ORF type:complete len:659 (-),score=109.98 TRINITY_DN2858_c0_g1_i1:357-2333(-)
MASGIRMRKLEMRKPKRTYTKRVHRTSESTKERSASPKRAARIVANEKLAKLAKKPKVNDVPSPTKEVKSSTSTSPVVPQPAETTTKSSVPKVVVVVAPNSAPIKPRRGRPPRIRPPAPVETHDEPSNGTDEEIEEEEKTICKKSSKKRKESDEEDCSIDVESISPSRSPSPGIVQSISSRNSGLIQVPLGPRQSFSWFEVVGITLHRLCEETGRQYFHHKHEICKYMDDNWNTVCLGHERTSTWWKTVLATITTRREFFVSEGRGSGHWKLHDNHAEMFKTLWDSHVSGKNAGVVLEIACASAPSKMYQSRRALARSLSPDDESGTKKRKSTAQKKRKLKHSISEESFESPRANLRRHSYPLGDRFGICHHCEQERPHVAFCTQCPLKYCASCLHEYGETLDKTLKQTNWKCPKCRSICQCDKCIEEEEGGGGVEEHLEEHTTKIMASRIEKDGERQYCVRWYDQSSHNFSTSWESKESLIRRSHSLTKYDAQQLQAQMKNILSYDLQCFYRPVSTQPVHKKSRADKLRSADFDIGRMVSPTSLPCRLPQQPIQEINISTPSWRIISENDEDENEDSDSDSEDEDESDETFITRHARAAIEMRKQIDRVIESSISSNSGSLLTRSAPSVAVLSTTPTSTSPSFESSAQRASRLRNSK